uniref:ELMO domain-containing protein n=1 Tax=Ascaris lumbricoides TaxID=6252 RepID=A0A0M3IXL1_ASCLU
MSERMEKVMSQIRGYRELCALVEARRLEKYDVENVTHEKSKVTAGIQALSNNFYSRWKFAEKADRVVRDNTYYCEKISASMSERMEKVMSQIRGYRELCALVEARRLEKYDVENVTHEKRLLRLWDILMPEEKLTGRVTKQWQKIGFQVKCFSIIWMRFFFFLFLLEAMILCYFLTVFLKIFYFLSSFILFKKFSFQ